MKAKTIFAALIGLALGATVLSGCSGAQTPTVAAQSSEPPGITVVGEAKVFAVPDVAYISLGVESTGATAKQAMDENARRMNEVVAQIKALGIAERDIQSSGISLYPVYEDKRVMTPSMPTEPVEPVGTPTIVGYRASNQVRLNIYDLDRAPEVLDGVVGVGANSVSGLQFSIKDDSKLRQQALSDAAKQTREKAQVVAEALGVRITSIASVREEYYGGPIPVAEARAASMQGMGDSTPVMAGELTVSARVMVTFNYQ